MTELEQKIGYSFQNPQLLHRALCHSSYANEVKGGESSNERLEFLGDAVLSIVVSRHIFLHFTHLPEGELTKLRAALVCEKSLHKFALALGLGEHLLLGKGESQNGGRARPSILADAFEALIAALYLDGGIDAAGRFIMRYVSDAIEEFGHKPAFKDYKTALQEIIQKNPEEQVEYVLTGESGPDHDKRFTVEVHLNSNVIGRGTGRSKKDAEQDAAHQALQLMGEEI